MSQMVRTHTSAKEAAGTEAKTDRKKSETRDPVERESWIILGGVSLIFAAALIAYGVENSGHQDQQPVSHPVPHLMHY